MKALRRVVLSISPLSQFLLPGRRAGQLRRPTLYEITTSSKTLLQFQEPDHSTFGLIRDVPPNMIMIRLSLTTPSLRQVVLYAGPSTSSRKVAEYGGNTIGFGSRSVLGSGWPTDQVKVEGDTVTFSFEMRSGREHNTPDRAIWGFACTVRAQESALFSLLSLFSLSLSLSLSPGEEDMLGMPVLADTALGLSTLTCHALRVLYNGPPTSKEEQLCRELMESKLLQREIVQPGEIEIAVVAAAVKHLKLDIDEKSLKRENSENFVTVSKVLTRLNTTLRKLQSLAELEQRWDHTREEFHVGLGKAGEAFFSSYHLQESTLGELELLCFITGVVYDIESPEDAVRELLELVADKSTEPTDTIKYPNRTRYLGHVTGYQPIRDQYFLIRPDYIASQYTGDSRGPGIQSISFCT
eukprot:sb/3465178/